MASIQDTIQAMEAPTRYSNDDWSGLVDLMVNTLNERKHSRMKFTPTVLQKSFISEIQDRDEKAKAKLRLFLACDNWFKDKRQKFDKAYLSDPYKTKIKKEYRRGLPIGTKVSISKARKKGVTVENPFTKPTQRGSYWDKNVSYTIHSRQRVGYPEPFFVYRIKRDSDGKVIRVQFYRKELFVKPNTKIYRYKWNL